MVVALGTYETLWSGVLGLTELTICDRDAVVDPDNLVKNCEPMVLATGEAIKLADPDVQDGDRIGPSMMSAQLSCYCCLLSLTADESGKEPAFRNSRV